ncbi:fibropellin-1-like [Macrobrachium nipponense]|uniref:fibropellin-1-like n=1 Tax=Macrobrachium nipponense TaxID=159736 RepID=UPI0030C841D0
MKTSPILVGCCLLAMALCYVPDHTEGGDPGGFGHWHELDCKPTDACIDNGGYCIRNNKKEDCYGLLFPKECRSPICSCCVEDESKCLRNPCQNNTVCTNTSGSYQCGCLPGYNLTAEGCVGELDKSYRTFYT